jgi:hypothetical protein
VAFQIESSEAQKALMEIGKARKKMHRRAKQLTKMHQMMMQQQHDNSSSPDDRSHHQKSSESISSPSVHLKKKLTLNKTPKHTQHSPSKSHKDNMTHPDHTEMDAFNGMIKEYVKQQFVAS